MSPHFRQGNFHSSLSVYVYVMDYGVTPFSKYSLLFYKLAAFIFPKIKILYKIFCHMLATFDVNFILFYFYFGG